MILSVSDVNLSFGSRAVLRQFGLDLARGQSACLLGASGCGKTSVLRCIAGFETPQSGRITVNGRDLFSGSLNVPAHLRRIGMVFQDYALFPHLNVADNIAFGLRGQTAAERDRRVAALLELVDLVGCGKRFAHQLSGGQQQRVALARALAPRPDFVLLDEPFSSLDADLRARLSQEVRALLQQEGVSALLVTHDQYEAFAFADKIGVMSGGYLHQWDSADHLYRYPATPEVAAFVGAGAWLAGVTAHGAVVETVLGRVSGSLKDGRAGVPVRVWVRPEQLQWCAGGSARVLSCTFQGGHSLCRVQVGQTVLLLHSEQPPPCGADIALQWRQGVEVAVFADTEE